MSLDCCRKTPYKCAHGKQHHCLCSNRALGGWIWALAEPNYPGDALMSRGKSVRLLAAIPESYTPDFMQRLDKRTVLGKAIVDRYEAVLGDLGGEDNISSIKCSLARRFTWYEAMIEGFECRAAAGEEIDIGSWTQLTNSWLGIARLLGLERKAHSARTLRDKWDEAARNEVSAA